MGEILGVCVLRSCEIHKPWATGTQGPVDMQMGLLCWCQGCFRGSSRRSSSHLKDFLRSAEGQGGGSGEHSGDSETESRRRARERGREEGERERADSPPWPCNYIQSLLGAQRGVGAHAGLCWLGSPGEGPGERQEVTSAQWGSYRGERADFLPWLSLRNRLPAWFNPCYTAEYKPSPAHTALQGITEHNLLIMNPCFFLNHFSLSFFLFPSTLSVQGCT